MPTKLSAKLLAITTLTATLGAFAATDYSAATATPSTTPRAAPAADALAVTPASHHRGAVHLTAYTNNDGPTETVIVTGAIGDYGEAVSVYPDGTIDPEHDSELSLQLSHGSLRLDTASLDKAFVTAMRNNFPTDAATCSGSVNVMQRVPIVSGSGTGAYKGVTGDFTLTATLDEVDTSTTAQPCNGTAAFLSQAIVISGPGSVAF